MSHYRPYPAYKNSGVEWLGEVPEHWKVSAVKWEFESRLGKMLQPRPNDLKDFEVPYHKAVSVQWEKIALEAPEAMWASASDIETYQIRKGDLLICEGGDVGRAAIFQSDDSEPLIIQNSIHRVRPRNGNLNEGLLRVMQTVRAAGWFDVLCSKATIVHFTGEKLGSLAYPVAPVAEQRAIATHLDRETTRIDGLVSKKTRFIELLREKRQALVTHAVTKGLNPNVKMKDSGVEWLGVVPEHWGAMAIKHIVATPITDGPHETPNFVDEGIPFISAEAVSSGKINFEKIRSYITKEDHQRFSQKYRPERGDIFMVKSGATTGVSAIVDTDIDFNIWSPLAVIRCGARSDPRFVLNYMRSRSFQDAIELNWSYGTQQNIGMGVIGDLAVTVPPIDEQIEIASYIDNETARIDILISSTERSIELLKERRSALITAAVTGQIDVRENPARQEQLAA